MGEEKNVSIGSMVEIIHKSETQRYRRRTIGMLLGADEREITLSLRPEFGTTNIPVEWVWKVTKVPDDAEVIVNERVE